MATVLDFSDQLPVELMVTPMTLRFRSSTYGNIHTKLQAPQDMGFDNQVNHSSITRFQIADFASCQDTHFLARQRISSIFYIPLHCPNESLALSSKFLFSGVRIFMFHTFSIKHVYSPHRGIPGSSQYVVHHICHVVNSLVM
jgi:hypothetical protein